jgi:hypothetical protein
MKKILNFIVLVILGAAFAACEKADPFVDRVVSPVLVEVQGIDGVPASGLTTEPTVPASITADAGATIKILELDKSGILDYKIGIDSIPVSGIKISYKLRSTGALVKEVTTDSKGMANLSTSWASLGVTAPKTGSTVKLIATGTYKDQQFSKYFSISGK